jgi:hypothetical protein
MFNYSFIEWDRVGCYANNIMTFRLVIAAIRRTRFPHTYFNL